MQSTCNPHASLAFNTADAWHSGIGTVENRRALIHSFVHIESVAIDLSWDIIVRWSDAQLPREFFDDWLRVASDEARHYRMLDERLRALGGFYGEFNVHDGLWECAQDTSDSLMARLVVEHIVHEGRGLDVTPTIIKRLRSANDADSAKLLDVILAEEVSHVAAGLKWFRFLCEREQLVPQQHLATLVQRYYKGRIKGPFNHAARSQAGLTEDFYVPLAT
jgi:uncharacterized ferritin-like protein (DUF455 family)